MNTPKPLRVLYAENNEDACSLVTTMLEFSDIEVVIAGTVADAWFLGQTQHFDLYLLASRFSDGSGLDLCRRFREYEPHSAILFYSDDAFESDTQNGLLAGADAYLVKPYFEDLAQKILQTIAHSKASVSKNLTNSFLGLDRATLLN